MSNAYELIRTAIINRQQITAVYQGHYREMCPHAIGTKHGKRQALLYQFGGSSSSGLGPPGSWGNWRCVRVDELEDVQVRDGEWFTGSNHSRMQTCIDIIDVQVSF